jgi:hypothetical protein
MNKQHGAVPMTSTSAETRQQNSTDIELTVEVDIPPMYLPMPLRQHPDLSLLEARGVEWMRRHGFCQSLVEETKVIDTQTALFFANLCPDADTERLQLAVDWGYLMFRFDDMQCEQESGNDVTAFVDTGVRLVRTLETPDACVIGPDNPFHAPVRDLARRLRALSTPTRIRRLVDAHRAWFSGVAWQIAMRPHMNSITLNDHLFTRLLHSAALPTLTWLQIVENDEIPDEVIHAPLMSAVTEMAGTIAAIDNDLFSYGKELWLSRQHGAYCDYLVGNTIHTMMASKGLKQDEAMIQCVELRDCILDRFIQVRDKILASADPPLARYLQNLTCLVRGNCEFHQVEGRYTNPDGEHRQAIRFCLSKSDRPSATGAPPGLTAIDWWWEVESC